MAQVYAASAAPPAVGLFVRVPRGRGATRRTAPPTSRGVQPSVRARAAEPSRADAAPGPDESFSFTGGTVKE